jgi:hypothetical protein
MRRLWRDIKDHPFSAALFLVYWLAVWGAHWYLKWNGGIPTAGLILHLLAPVIAGGLVGWWRAPTLEGLLVGRGHLAGGPLAAALVIELDIVLLFGTDQLDDVLHGKWPGVREWLVEGFFEWLEWSVAFGIFALGLGLIGAYAGAKLARVAHAGANQ